MGKLRFGKEEKVFCLQDIPLKGAKGEPLCLGHHYTTTWFLGGVRLEDQGYVIKVRHAASYYPMPEPAVVAELQAEGSLPSPLPPYEIRTFDCIFAYSLWWGIGLAVLASVLVSRRSRRRRAADAETPLTAGQPVIKTKVDRFIADEMERIRRPGEVVQYQAYGSDIPLEGFAAVRAKGLFAVVTDQRVVFITTRVGAFGILRENRGVETIDRSQIAEVHLGEDDHLRFVLTDGTAYSLVIRRGQRGVSNQVAFIRDVPRVLSGAVTGLPLLP